MLNRKTRILLIAVIPLVLYANSFGNRFAFDDEFIIKQNVAIRSLGNIGGFFAAGYWPSLPALETIPGIDNGLYRPLAILSYAVDYSIWKLNPFGYHILNVLSHALNAVLVFLILASMLSGLRNAERIAFFSSLVFAVHPVNTEAVTGIVGRADTLSTSFVLLSLLFYVSEKRRYFVSLLFFFAALLTKEMAVTLPALVILCDACFGKRGVKSRLKYYAPYFLIALIYLVVRYSVLGAVFPAPAKQVLHNDAIPARFLTFSRVFVHYVKLMFYPVNLRIDYGSSFPSALTLGEPYVALSVLMLCFYAGVFVMAWRRDKAVFFPLAWFLLALLPVSHIVPIGALMAERFLYLPGMGFAVFLGLALGGMEAKTVRALFLAFILLFFSARAIRRNADWYSNYTLWRKAVSTAPKSPSAYYNFATAALNEGRYGEAMDSFRKCITGALAMTDFDRKRYARLPESFLYLAYNNLGVACYNSKEYDDAIGAFKEVIRLKPDSAGAYGNLGNVYVDTGMFEEAIQSYRKCIEIAPGIAGGHYNLGLLYKQVGRYEEALEECLAAIGIEPRNADICFTIGKIYSEKDMHDRAAEWFGRAFGIRPDFGEARRNYGVAVRKIKG